MRFACSWAVIAQTESAHLLGTWFDIAQSEPGRVCCESLPVAATLDIEEGCLPCWLKARRCAGRSSGADALPVPMAACVLRVRPALARQELRRRERGALRARRWRCGLAGFPPLPLASSYALFESPPHVNGVAVTMPELDLLPVPDSMAVATPCKTSIAVDIHDASTIAPSPGVSSWSPSTTRGSPTEVRSIGMQTDDIDSLPLTLNLSPAVSQVHAADVFNTGGVAKYDFSSGASIFASPPVEFVESETIELEPSHVVENLCAVAQAASFRVHATKQVRLFAPEWAARGFDFHFRVSLHGHTCNFDGGCDGCVPEEGNPTLDRLFVCLRCDLVLCAGCTSYHSQDHWREPDLAAIFGLDDSSDSEDACVFEQFEELHRACIAWQPDC